MEKKGVEAAEHGQQIDGRAPSEWRATPSMQLQLRALPMPTRAQGGSRNIDGGGWGSCFVLESCW